jgi:hypothetical protein
MYEEARANFPSRRSRATHQKIRSASNAGDYPGSRRYPAPLSEFEPLFLNGLQRSVNRKVQGSNPCSGANFEFGFRPKRGCQVESCSNRAATISKFQKKRFQRYPGCRGIDPRTHLLCQC